MASKVFLLKDPISQEKRYLEMRKNTKTEKASKSISEMSLEIDRLAGQVSAMESVISKGGKIVEPLVLTLIELLMIQLLKLDGIVKRVQKYVETLDMLKVKNSMHSYNGSRAHTDNKHIHSNGVLKPRQRDSDVYSYARAHQLPQQQPKPPQASQPPIRHSTSGIVVTTNWETFDAAPTLTAAISMASSPANNAVQTKCNWELFE